ncbi:hypothetical protein [Halomonas sp. H10-9-1]|uniref:hypothetical protein n=1 Tax=Halomonas sp. H10-9-1 TaxID=2950871 RepID=UPI0032E04682
MNATMLKELRERKTAAQQRRDYHHQQFDEVLADLKALGAECGGVYCPKVKAAGATLSRTTRGEVYPPFQAFADALLAYARTKPGENQGEGVTRLANLAMHLMREMAHHIKREEQAQQEVHCYQALASGLRKPTSRLAYPGGLQA